MDSVVGRGTVLAGRYQLTDPRPCGLPGTTEWNATDQILVRPVVVRVFPAAGAGPALDAARRAALVTDPRLVRVLDVGSDEGTGYVVTEQVSGPTLAQLVAREPLSADQARAVVGEAASALEAARRRGVHHLALRPSAVAVSDDGRVLVSGLALDATLFARPRGDARTTSRTDATDLVRLAYAALTGHWPGPGETADGLPTAPETDGVPVAPAELVTGVPADLNTLCAVTLGRDDDGPLSPADLVRELEPWGEIKVQGRPRVTAAPPAPAGPTTAPGQVVRQSVRTAFSGSTPAVDRSVTPPPAAPVPPAPVASWVPTGSGPLPADDAPTPAMGVPAAPPPEPAPPADAPAPAAPVVPDGLETGPAAPTTPVAPRPAAPASAPTRTSAFPSASAAPLPAGSSATASAPTTGLPPAAGARPAPVQPAAFPAPPAAVAPGARAAGSLPPAVPPPGPLGAGPGAGPSSFAPAQRPAAQYPPAQYPATEPDPFDFGRIDDEPPRRRVGTAIAIVVVGLLVVAGIAFAAKALFGGRGAESPGAAGTTTSQSPSAGASGSASAGPSSAAPSGSPTPTARPGATATIASIQSIDPSDADGEHQEAVARAFDGDPGTFWYTMTYKRDDFAGFKPAVGLALTLSEPATVSTVTLHVNGTGGNVEVRTGDATTPDSGTVLASGPMSADTVLQLDPAQTGSSLTIWFTQLPTTADGSFRVELTEIQLS